MPLGRETIGTAYVRVLADGSGLDKEVEREMRGVDSVMKDSGKRGGESYNEAWLKEFDKGLDEIAKKENEANRRRTNQNRGFRSQLTKTVNEFDRLASAVQNDLDGLSEKTRQVWGDIGKLNEDLERDTRSRWRRMSDSVRQFHLGLNTDTRIAAANTRRRLGNLFEPVQTGARDAESVLGKFNRRMDEMNSRWSFGKGARNDFIHGFGVMIGLLNKAVLVVPKVVEGFAGLIGGGGGGGGASLAKLGEMAGAAGTSLIGVAIALAAIIAVSSIAAALISGIAAALIALAGSAVFAAAAVGGIALALGPVLAGGVAVGIAALTHLDKETKGVAKSLGKTFGDLGKSAGEAIGPGLRRAMRLLTPAVKGLEPLFDATARAMGRVATGWARITRGKAFEDFKSTMVTFLPNAIEDLGKAAGNFGEGMLGVFQSLAPLANDFFDWLVRITGRFDRWANSKAGQETLRNFWEDAKESAKAVGKFILAAADAFGTLASKGKDTGDTLFDKMTAQLEDLTAWLEDPKNQKSIRDFFENGKNTAIELGETIDRLGTLLDDLDTEESRQDLDDLFDTIQTVADGIDRLVDGWTWLRQNSAVDLVINLSADGLGGKVLNWLTGQTSVPTFTIPLPPFPFKWAIEQGAAAASRIGGFFSNMFDKIRPKGIKWGDLIPKIKWGDLIPNIRWHDLIPRFKWGDMIPDVRWKNIIPGVRWRAFVPALRWAAFVPKMIWSNFVSMLRWATFVPRLVWGAFVSALKWTSYLTRINWGALIPDINWSDFIPPIPTLNVDINWPSPPGWFSKISSGAASLVGRAAGGLEMGPAMRLVGEGGPEAIVPLNRPLAQVDPSVRMLSAIAQGKAVGGSTTNSLSRTIDVGGITVVTPTKDPRAVAAEVVNRLAAVGY